ncbi:MAG: hypothetical protein LAQ69_01465 [Acidobacteriia bacterium]|nr:hypothetical protein [Terriglobia bacterium]
MRTISNAAMATLLVVALFLGNCFSCPQVLLALQSHQPAHGCCHRTKPTTENCQTQVLRHFVKADPGTATPSVPMAVGVVEPLLAAALPQGSSLAFNPVDHAPPDLLSLHSTFRI